MLRSLAAPTGQWVYDHVRAGKAVFVAEIEAAGFELIAEPEVHLFRWFRRSRKF